LALASKWTAIYGIAILGGLFLLQNILNLIDKKSQLRQFVKKMSLGVIVFLIIPLIVYLFSYVPFFTSGHTWQQFDELQHQMWWYHTGLKASHPYTSPWYSWPFLYRPVWYYVNYGQNSISNIYAMGNPVIWWGGVIAIAYVTVLCIKYVVLSMKKRYIIHNSLYSILLLSLGYFGFFLPWALSPRIMFLYHYLPSIPFMCLALGYGLDKIWYDHKYLSIFYLLFSIFVFFYFYPHLSALPVPKWWTDQYFWFKSWR
jgi:dolichyl-phosphate-mannose--protein O-mannosyl transferase